jgi:hypothetical protein
MTVCPFCVTLEHFLISNSLDIFALIYYFRVEYSLSIDVDL